MRFSRTRLFGIARFVQKHRLVPITDNPGTRNPKVFQHLLESTPVAALMLTAPVQPLENDQLGKAPAQICLITTGRKGSQIGVLDFPLLSLLSPAVRFAYVYQPVLSAYVSFAGSAIPSSPSPCDRRYRLRVLSDDLTPFSSLTRRMLFLRLIHPTSTRQSGGGGRVSQVPDASLTACHALGPPRPLGNLTISIPLYWLPAR